MRPMPEAGIPEVFVDAIRTIETVGSCIRIEFTSGPDAMAAEDRQPAIYLVIAIDRIPEAMRLLAQWCAASASAEIAERVGALVH